MIEDEYKSRLRASFPAQTKYAVIHVLDIPDEYQKGDPELIELIRKSTTAIIENAQS